MSRENCWSDLSRQQVGWFAQRLVEMEFCRSGFRVFVPDVDDRGIDTLVFRNDVGYLNIQVKSRREYGYIFVPKARFSPRGDLLLAVVIFCANEPEMLEFTVSLPVRRMAGSDCRSIAAG